MLVLRRVEPFEILEGARDALYPVPESLPAPYDFADLPAVAHISDVNRYSQVAQQNCRNQDNKAGSDERRDKNQDTESGGGSIADKSPGDDSDERQQQRDSDPGVKHPVIPLFPRLPAT